MRNRHLILFYFLSISYLSFSQSDSSLSLHIIDQKIVIDKRKLSISFSYYFENQSNTDLIIVDYYEPCYWENQKRKSNVDTVKSLLIFLVIKDDSGQVLYPTKNLFGIGEEMTNQSYKIDSSLFYTKYEENIAEEHRANTRVIEPKNMLVDLFTMRLNNRRCFQSSTFNFDFTRKYKLSLCYMAKEDLYDSADEWILKHANKVFIGRIESNQVDIFFK